MIVNHLWNVSSEMSTKCLHQLEHNVLTMTMDGGVTQGTIGGRFVVLALAVALFSVRKDAIILYKTVKGDIFYSCTCHLTGKSNLKLSSPFNLEVLEPLK